MFAKTEATDERVAAYVAALEREKNGYQRRLASIKAGVPDRLGDKAEVLVTDRIAQVDAELKQVRKSSSKETKAE